VCACGLCVCVVYACVCGLCVRVWCMCVCVAYLCVCGLCLCVSVGFTCMWVVYVGVCSLCVCVYHVCVCGLCVCVWFYVCVCCLCVSSCTLLTPFGSLTCYGVALVSRINKIIGLFCKRALQKSQYSAKDAYNFIDPINCSHPIHV